MPRMSLEPPEPSAAPVRGRLRRLAGWVRRRPACSLALVLGLGFVALNALAFAHAGAMTTFVPAGESTAKPEALSWRERASALAFGVRVRRPVNHRTPAAAGLPFSTEVLDARGSEVEVWLVRHEASRGVVVLCHGYAASKASLIPVAEEFYARGYSCLLVDFRGSGGSAGSTTSLGYHEAADVVAAVHRAEALTTPGQPVILFGTSMGAAAALRAIHAESVAPTALILEAPYNRLLDTVRNRFRLMGVPSFPSAELLVFWGGVRGGIDGFAHDPADYAASVTCPTLILHGDQDQRVSVIEVREVFDNLSATSRKLVLLEGVGHESYVAACGPAWRAAVDEFLRSLGE